MTEENALQINICHLYPDLLNIYGDRGNVTALKKRCEWRNISVNICNVSLGDEFIPSEYDMVFMGGGQDYEQEIIQRDIRNKKGAIIDAIDEGMVFLCICGGYQLLGKYYRTWEGKEIEFLDILDIWTIGGKKRMIGNMVFECTFLKSTASNGLVAGFENHSGRTYLGSSVEPLGKVVEGFGNNGEDSNEGARYKNVFCSYSHGSLLPKNPELADYLILTALKRKYPHLTRLAALDDIMENCAHDAALTLTRRTGIMKCKRQRKSF